jgi:hypothetical protein
VFGLLLLAAVAPAYADDDGHARLEDALQLYADGQTARARAELMGVIGGAEVSPAVRRAALASLGDILYAEEGPEAARPFFVALLDEAPDYVMDPLDHPEPVCHYFEELRVARASSPPIVPLPPPTRRPPPWASMAPGGVYWFSRGNVGAGVAVGLTQAGLLVSNLALKQAIDGIETIPRDDAEGAAEYRRLQLFTNLTAGAFYASLILPPAIEFSRWGADGAPGAATRVAIGPGTVAVRGSF